jgi:hypothetical protein
LFARVKFKLERTMRSALCEIRGPFLVKNA